METRHFLCFLFFSFGFLVGCSKKVSTVSVVVSNDKLPTLEEPGPENTAEAELRKKPITTAKDEVGEVLAKWWQEGVAAGNVGDYFDNRLAAAQ